MMLSYIIPVFNGSGTIRRCLDSILHQDVPETMYEVIVIDDCSTDDTVAILDEYKAGYSNVIVLRQPYNQRQGAARNVGLSMAKGEYVTFVDADDVVESGVVSAIEFAERTAVDILCAGAVYSEPWSPESFNARHVYSPEGEVFDGRYFCETYFDFLTFNGTTPWGNLYRRGYLLGNYRPFEEGRQWEDNDWVAFHFYHASSVACISPVMYRYISNPVSTMNTLSFSSMVDRVACCCRRMRFFDSLSSDGSSFAHKVYNQGVCSFYIDDQVNFKYLSVFALSDLLNFYVNLGQNDVDFLAGRYDGTSTAKFVFKHRSFTMILFLTLIPLMKVYRLLRFGSTCGYKKKKTA